ncbi:MAG TPA: cupin domain-containing protein [Candidatus Tectomicrobia bacterium]|jgi:quercetin dioxygenase-like cupin family protein
MYYPTRIALVSVVFALAMPALAQDGLKELDKGSSTREQVLTERLAIGGELREARINVATFEPKTAGAWHVHPAPVYVYVLQGTLTFEAEGKKPRVVQAGQATAEDLNTRMRVVNYGDEVAKTIVFQLSEPNAAFRQKEKSP